MTKDPRARSRLAKTNVSKDNLDPLFYEVLDIEVCCNKNIDQMPPFILDVHDKDSGLLIDSKDHLGRAIIKIKDVFDGENGSFIDLQKSNQLRVPVPKWHDIAQVNCSGAVSYTHLTLPTKRIV